MRKKLFTALFCVSLFSIKAFSQSNPPLDSKDIVAQKNFEHDRASILNEASWDVPIPDSIMNKVNEYASTNNIAPLRVSKNLIYLKTLYNEKLAYADRLFMAKRGIDFANKPNAPLPLQLFNDIYISLKSKISQ